MRTGDSPFTLLAKVVKSEGDKLRIVSLAILVLVENQTLLR